MNPKAYFLTLLLMAGMSFAAIGKLFAQQNCNCKPDREWKISVPGFHAGKTTFGLNTQAEYMIPIKNTWFGQFGGMASGRWDYKKTELRYIEYGFEEVWDETVGAFVWQKTVTVDKTYERRNKYFVLSAMGGFGKRFELYKKRSGLAGAKKRIHPDGILDLGINLGAGLGVLNPAFGYDYKAGFYGMAELFLEYGNELIRVGASGGYEGSNSTALPMEFFGKLRLIFVFERAPKKNFK
jgi:hypothetical protein